MLSREANVPSAKRTRREEQGPTLPITLDPQDSSDFLDALLRTKEAWLEVSYSDGRKEVRRWGCLTHEYVIECDRQPEKQAGISKRNLAEQRDRQPTGKR